MAWIDTASVGATWGISSATFTGMAIGTASSSRHVVVCVTGFMNSATGITGVTIGGVTATELYTFIGNNNGIHSFWVANVPSGSTANVVATFNATDALWDGFAATAVFTDAVTLSDTMGVTSGASTFGGTIDVPASGELLAVAFQNYDGGTAGSSRFTWTGATEDFEEAVGVVFPTGASETGLSSQTGRTVEVTTSATWGVGHIITAITFTVAGGGPPPPTPTGHLKVWLGSSWELKPLKVWSGSAWVTKPVKRWDGSQWLTVH